MSKLSHYIKLRSGPSGCNAKQFECDKYLDCDSCLEDKIKEHDKQVRAEVIDSINDNIHEIYKCQFYCMEDMCEHDSPTVDMCIDCFYDAIQKKFRAVKGAEEMTRELLLEYICPGYRAPNCFKGDISFNCSDCNRVLNEMLDKYDKHVIEQYKANTELKDTIRDIHDNVAQEMYCKGIDDFLTEICKMIVQSENNGNYRFYAVEIKQSIADLAEQLKAGGTE